MRWWCPILALAAVGVGGAAADEYDLTGGTLLPHYVAELTCSSDPPPEGWCGACAEYAYLA